MKTGFLTLSTHPSHPGLVQARVHEKLPDLSPSKDGDEIRYSARFADIDAGLMHVQNNMHGSLVDLEKRIYRQSLAEMIACVEADDIAHSRIWIDPGLPPDEMARIDALTKKRKSSQRRVDRVWQTVGFTALLLLLLLSLLL